MTTTSSIPPRRNRGCLWGCLAVLAFFLLPVLAAAGYGAWFFYYGYAQDPVLRAVMELVRHDGMAEAALGENIHVTGVGGSALAYMPGSQTGSYDVQLSGTRGGGDLRVTARMTRGHLTVDSMILEGPHQVRYDLMHHLVMPGPQPSDAI